MEAVVIMGTKTNKAVPVKLGFPSSKINQATESDLIVAIKAERQRIYRFCPYKVGRIASF